METESSPSQLNTVTQATQALQPLAQIQRLLMLDDLWTAYLEDARSEQPIERVDFGSLIALAKEMELALRETPAAAGRVRELLEDLPPEADDGAIGMIGTSNERIAGALATVLSRDLRGLDPRRAFIAACRFVEIETNDEIAHLIGKCEQLEQGNLPDPDLRINFRCISTLVGIGALWGLAAAGATTVVGAPIAIGAGVLGAGSDLIKKWKKSGCKSDAPHIVKAFT